MSHFCEIERFEQLATDGFDDSRTFSAVLVSEHPYVLQVLQNVQEDIPGAIVSRIDIHRHAYSNCALEYNKESITPITELAEDVSFFEYLVEHHLIHLHLVLPCQVRRGSFLG